MSLLEPDPPSEQFTVKDALDFAERMATFELQRMDRMHVRFLWFIGIAVTVVLAFLTLLGFIGYNNLRTLATEAAAAQLRTEVAKQIDSKLSGENLPGIVHEEVQAYSAKDLRRQVSQEINKGVLHEQILDVGKQEIAALDKTLFEPRRLTTDDARRITRAIDADDLLAEQPYVLVTELGSSEAYLYGAQIGAALDESQLVLLTEYTQLALNKGAAGVAVYCREGSDCSSARHLATALGAGRIKADVITSPFLADVPPKGKKDAVIVWVGPKYVR